MPKQTTITIDESVKKRLEQFVVGKETWTDTFSRIVDKLEKMKTAINKVQEDYEKVSHLMMMLKEVFEAFQEEDIYGSLIDMEEHVTALNDPRLSSMYNRLIEDYRASLHRNVLDSDFKRFWEHYTKISTTIGESFEANLKSLTELAK